MRNNIIETYFNFKKIFYLKQIFFDQNDDIENIIEKQMKKIILNTIVAS